MYKAMLVTVVAVVTPVIVPIVVAASGFTAGALGGQAALLVTTRF